MGMKPLDVPRPTDAVALQGGLRGRGAASNRVGRYLQAMREADAEQLEQQRLQEGVPERVATVVQVVRSRQIISHNQSPDIPFRQSINPYQGCEHGCIYCYARPSHAWHDLSPGLDFETRLFAKPDAADLLRKELAKPGYQASPIMLGANTDPYQPIDRQWQITRQLLQVLLECRHPVGIITKSALIERDLDLLQALATQGLVQTYLSVTTLDAELARRLEPRAATPLRRLQAIRALREAGVPVGVLVAPIIPALTDAGVFAVLQAAAEAGAGSASYVILRLPLEIRDLFVEWLQQHYPQRAEHVMSVLQQMRGGQDYQSTYGERMKGRGPYADMLRQQFALHCRRLGLVRRSLDVRCDLFQPPLPANGQLSLF